MRERRFLKKKLLTSLPSLKKQHLRIHKYPHPSVWRKKATTPLKYLPRRSSLPLLPSLPLSFPLHKNQFKTIRENKKICRRAKPRHQGQKKLPAHFRKLATNLVNQFTFRKGCQNQAKNLLAPLWKRIIRLVELRR